jgi:hypothetical protein
VYTVSVTPQQTNGTLTVSATAYTDCYNPYTSINLTVTAPNGAHGSGSGSGAAYASAQASVSVANQVGNASYSATGDTSDTCWDLGYSGGSYEQDGTIRLNDLTPSIATISQTSWNAGVPNRITLTGTNFGTLPTLNIDDSARISFSYISRATTQIVADANVAAVTPAESANLSVVSHGWDGNGFQSTGGNPAGSPSRAISISPVPAPTPQIVFQGNNVAGAGAQSVVVGQQIALNRSVTIPPGLAISVESWTVDGTPIAGYTADANSDSVTQLTSFVGSSMTFYWIAAASSLNVTYSYCMVNNQCNEATATFNVDAPHPIVVSTNTGQWQILGSKLSYGDKTVGATHGILFTLTPPLGYSGSYQWVQVIKNDTVYLTVNGTNFTCGPDSGLDNTYPYSTTNPVGDSPESNLVSSASYQQHYFDATMYLMWSPGLPSSIFVPLGHLEWITTGTAVNTSNVWSIDTQNSSPPAGSSPAFQLSATYPSWTVNVLNNQLDCH